MVSGIDLTIVISSFNRDDKILETLVHLFQSETDGIGRIELLIVDDGSPRPVRTVIEDIGQLPEPFELRLIEQQNLGIGATRNRGFREARSHLILFLDDDILVRAETVKSFLDADRTHPGGVIFGSYPFRSHSSESLEKFAASLYGYDRMTAEPAFEKVDAITSGLLCVDRKKIGEPEKFFRDDLAIPAAEEHEIIFRFHNLDVPIYQATHIFATHNHHLELNWLVEQQYKYGLATAEAFDKVPEIVKMPRFKALRTKLEFRGVMGSVKRLAATKQGRASVLRMAQSAESRSPDANHDFLFGLAASSHFWAGYRADRSRC